MDSYQVFISYRRDGGEFLAGRLADRLVILGYTVFFDVESIRSGEFNTQIFSAIDSCTDFLLILPQGGLDRCLEPNDWVRTEISYAIKRKKNIIPVFMNGFEFPDKLPEDIELVRYMQGVPVSPVFFEAVIDKIQHLLKSKCKSARVQTKGSKDRSHNKVKKLHVPLFIYVSNCTMWEHMQLGENLIELHDRFLKEKEILVLSGKDNSQKFVEGFQQMLRQGGLNNQQIITCITESILNISSMVDCIYNEKPNHYDMILVEMIIVLYNCICTPQNNSSYEEKINIFDLIKMIVFDLYKKPYCRCVDMDSVPLSDVFEYVFKIAGGTDALLVNEKINDCLSEETYVPKTSVKRSLRLRISMLSSDLFYDVSLTVTVALDSKMNGVSDYEVNDLIEKWIGFIKVFISIGRFTYASHKRIKKWLLINYKFIKKNKFLLSDKNETLFYECVKMCSV